MSDDADEVLYLTKLECSNGHSHVHAHEGPDVALDQSTPRPDATYCPTCLAMYDHDADFVEAHEARRVHPESAVEDDGPRELYERAMDLWGRDLQRDLAIEEAAEVIVASCHLERDRVSEEELIEEFADLKIMMEQMAVTYGAQFEEMYDHKLRRLESRIDNAEAGIGDAIAGDDGE